MTSIRFRNLPKAGAYALMRAHALLRDRNGVGAVEFAFVAPILVVLYIGAVEMTLALSVDTKVSRAGNITLDLITQGTSTSKNTLKEMVSVAESILAPYPGTAVELNYTAITVSDSGAKATVTWSWGSKTTNPYKIGSTVTIPKSLMVPKAFYIRGEIKNTHGFITSYPFTGTSKASLDLSETYYMRPRLGKTIDCTDCNT